ncbi:MAG: hypothetical protein ABIP48_03655 [Planctomycetota bacterium]
MATIAWRVGLTQTQHSVDVEIQIKDGTRNWNDLEVENIPKHDGPC